MMQFQCLWNGPCVAFARSIQDFSAAIIFGKKNNKIIRLSTIFQPLISSGRITHGKKLHRHLAEPCYFSPPCCSGLPVLPEAGAGPKATSAHTSSVGKQAWPLVNQIKPKKNMQVLRSRVVPSTLPLCVRMAAKLLKLCSRTSWPTMIQSMLFLFQGCSN